MASSGAWYRQGTVTVTNGSASITGVNTDWLTALIAVAIGDIFTVDSKTWYEIVNVSADTGITLDRNFEGATVAGVNYAIIRNTSGTVLTRIAGQVAVQFNQKQLFLDELRTWLNSTNATEMVTDSHGVSTAITTPTQMASEHSARVAQVDTLVNGISAMTKAEFFALAEQRKSQSAGSGYSFMGDAPGEHSQEYINGKGLFTQFPSFLKPKIGGSNANIIGVSGGLTLIANGVSLAINDGMRTYTNINYGISWRYAAGDNGFVIKFPTAPDGTKTYDSSTGTVTQHTSAAIAFAAETATNKVITSRQDFVFIETWHEKISDTGVVYPLGNVQYVGTTYEGITLAVNGIAQGYSAFGEWDSTTTGNCAVWANLTDAQKATFIQDHKNNIYSDNGELIQVRYRVRVVEGLGDDWGGISTQASGEIAYANTVSRITPKGSKISAVDLSTAYPFYTLGSISGQYDVNTVDSSIAHNGLLFAMPIALVQRRNIGTYYPSINPQGTTLGVRDTDAAQSGMLWYSSGYRKPTTLADCFDLGIYSGSGNYGRSDYGSISSGNSGRHDTKFYDAIYASDVKDLRMSSKKLPLKEIREKYKRMAIAGEVRGFEGVPYMYQIIEGVVTGSSTTFVGTTISATGTASSSYFPLLGKLYNTTSGGMADIGYVNRVSDTAEFRYINSSVGVPSTWKVGDAIVVVVYGWFVQPLYSSAIVLDNKAYNQHDSLISLVSHQQANPTWTDIIGSPANIAALTGGFVGQFNPELPTGSSQNWELTREATAGALLKSLRTTDGGATWLDLGVITVSNATNSIAYTMPTNAVDIHFYETQAHFTKTDTLGVALHKSTSVMAINNHNDAILVSSLTGEIPTSTDNNEELAITKTVNGVVSHTVESIAANVLFTTQIESDSGVAKFVFNIDDSGAIDGSKAQSFDTQYFISEE